MSKRRPDHDVYGRYAYFCCERIILVDNDVDQKIVRCPFCVELLCNDRPVIPDKAKQFYQNDGIQLNWIE